MCNMAGPLSGLAAERDSAKSGDLPATGQTGPALRRDQLVYLADLASELAAIADRLGSSTLAGLLELAHREARIEATRGL